MIYISIKTGNMMQMSVDKFKELNPKLQAKYRKASKDEEKKYKINLPKPKKKKETEPNIVEIDSVKNEEKQ